MRRLVLWVLSTLSVLVLLFSYPTSTTASPTTSPPRAISGAEPGAGSAAGATVTGPAVQTRWGPVQVAVTVDGGTITDVQVPVYPSDNGKDVEINGYALPILVQETLDQQGADIDMVSGATVTSEGYVASLQSALDEAGL